MAGIKNWKVDQAANFSFTLIYRDPDGDPIDLTQYRAKMTVAPAPGSKKVLAACNCAEGGGIVITPLEGKLQINFDMEKTKKFSFPRSAYDLVIIHIPTGEITRLLEGWLEVSRAVTVIE
jgi:hypothetical protein